MIPKARLEELILIYDSVYGDYRHSKDEKDVRDCLEELLSYRWRDAKVERVPQETTVRLKLNGKLGVGSYYMDNDGSWESPAPDYEAWSAYWDNDPGTIDNDFNPFEHDLVEWCYLPPSLPEGS